MQQLVATGGVDIRGVEDVVAHHLDATVLTRQTVDTAEERQGDDLGFDEGPAGTKCRTVVMGKHQVDVLQVAFVVLYRLVALLLRPVALQGCYDLYL